MLPQLRAYLLQNWSELPMGGPRPHELAFFVQATGVSKVCCYIFADDSPNPGWVAKMPRSPLDNQILEREYGVIRHLRQHGSDFVRKTVPGPLFTTYIDQHFIGLEPYLEGRTMDGMLIGIAPGALREYLDLGIDWLLHSQRETVVHRGPLTDRQFQHLLLDPIKRLHEEAQLTIIERGYLDMLRVRVLSMADRPLPLVFNHGDYRPGNIMVHGDSIKVIDWEFGAPAALPLLDVFSYLARTYARYNGLEEIDGYLEDYIAAFETVFFDQGTFGELTAEYVDRACLHLEIDPSWVDTLFALFLVTEANKFRAFLGERANRGYVYLLKSREKRIANSYLDQLDRQKNVWLLGHLAQHPERLVFHHSIDSPRDMQPQPAASLT